MHSKTYEDQEIGACHGDLIVCGIHNKPAFRFRCGPVPWGAMFSWSSCTCPYSRRGDEGRVRQAHGSFRYPKTFNTLRAAEGFRVDGIKVRRSELKRYVPTAWDDQYAHGEKSWKSHRKTQFLESVADKHAAVVC